jgi:DNA-binding NtrC family response regulator
VRGIVANYHGFATIETELGKGTTFRVFLPATPDRSQDVVLFISDQPRTLGRGELILIVDDEPSIREVGKAILSRHGYRVLTAGNGAEAMSAYVPRQDEIALVVTDVGMPEMSGNALARALCRLKPAQKILFMTGADGRGSVGESKPPFGSAVLNKPFVVDEFLSSVRKVLDNALAP